MSGFFVDSASAGNLIQGTYNSGLVVLSLLVAIFSSTMALQTASVARHTNQPWHRHVAVATGALALGGGIWTMHFIGMLSFELCTSVDYTLGMTALSFLPGLGASWIALRMLSRMTVSNTQLIAGGVLVGAGVGAMHYCGMAAMRMSAVLSYDPLLFALSILVAVVLATISLGVRFKLRGVRMHKVTRLVVAGAIMGLAIAGMHYTGMAAARFIGEATPRQGSFFIDSTVASLALSMFTITITVLVTATNGLVRYRQTFRQVRESESRIRAIVETAVDGIITINGKGIVQEMNRSAERMFGWSAHEVVGKNIKMLMPEPDRSQHDEYLSNFLSSGVPKVIGQGREVNAMHKSGRLIPVRLAVGRVDLPRSQLFVGFVTDISERRALEASLRDSVHNAEQAAEAKTAFLANMSHEIRTPMNAIIGFTELLLKNDLAPQQRSHLSIVHQSARSLLGLLNDVLDTTKLEKGAVALESIDFSLHELAQQVISSLRLSAENKNLDLYLDYKDDALQYFKGDPLRIQQVLTNLLGNAIKFTHAGHVGLTIFVDNGMVRMEVSDTGIGMSEEQLQRIFDPFSQADASISRRFGGTGLGTTIARQLIELMGGFIRVQSSLGQGSLFMVSLPLETGSKPEAESTSMSDGRLPPMRVLIADDVPQNLELLSHLLKDAGHEVVCANDGEEAVARFADGTRYDLVLMDVHMPRTDGLTASRRIREFEAGSGRKATPIIALTASVMESDRQAARAAGMDGFASKPLDVPRLRGEIRRVLGVESAAAQAAAAVPAPDAVIDWQAGGALWGSKQRMVGAIRSFLADQPQRHPLPPSGSTLASIDWHVAIRSLHGIRGAAANLALTKVAKLSARLEAAAKRRDVDFLTPLAQLKLELTLVQAALAVVEDELPDESAQDQITRQLQPEEVARLVKSLDAHFSRSELDEKSFEQFSEWLGATGRADLRHALQGAIDMFDFECARELLAQFDATLEEGKEEA
ncbi:MHYT domain-containing protein [Herbaspirillum robiniae]|uniref:Sensor protein FixL n=1 Tax=Herbaspirillum robiniae TaxID=2014887 RepID=A0A246WK95_9BURK|nr:MHYT domain-containing protein [Herbaspirillum robiniae]OWY26644.1 response regulator receiver protein [Herbaspirillum robiniae]